MQEQLSFSILFWGEDHLLFCDQGVISYLEGKQISPFHFHGSYRIYSIHFPSKKKKEIRKKKFRK